MYIASRVISSASDLCDPDAPASIGRYEVSIPDAGSQYGSRKTGIITSWADVLARHFAPYAADPTVSVFPVNPGPPAAT